MTPAADIEIIRMSRKHPAMWALMPQLLDRVLAFAVERDLRDVDMLLSRIQATFVLDTDALAVWITVDRNTGKVTGHLVATEDVWSGRKVGLVLQLVIDPGALPISVMKAINEEMKAWVRSREATETLAYTTTEHEKGWARLFGFERYRELRRQDLGDG